MYIVFVNVRNTSYGLQMRQAMTHEEIKQAAANTPKGANVRIGWTRPAHTLKDVMDVITKTVSVVARIAVEYDHMGRIIEARENGDLPQENQGLNGMVWEQYPLTLKAIKTGKIQLRLSIGTTGWHSITTWHMNGIEVPKSLIENYLLSNEKQHKELPACFNVGIENITCLNHVISEQHEAQMPVPA